MPNPAATITVSGNNKLLTSLICSIKNIEGVSFHENSLLDKSKYYLFIVDDGESLENVSQNLINLYAHCRENRQKLIVVLYFENSLDREKIISFRKLLDSLSQTDPIYRLVITTDLYSGNIVKHATNLDRELVKLLEGNSINISSKGNNLIHPLHIEDFLNAVTKVFFLNSTAGKSFFLLGDPIKDLDLAYLIKKILEDDRPDFQINTTLENIPHDVETQNIANLSQIDLNWRPKYDLELVIKNIYRQINTSSPDFQDNESPEIVESSKPKILENIRLVTKSWLNRHHRQAPKNKKLLSFKPVIVIILFIISGYLSLVGLFVLNSYLGFKNLSTSLDFIRQGKVEDSVSTVKKSKTYTENAINLYWSVSPAVQLYSKNINDEIYNLFTLSQYLQSSLENLQQSYVLSEKIFNSFTDDQLTINIDDQTLALKSSLSQVYDNLNQISLLVNSNTLPGDIQKKITDNPSYQKIALLENQVSQATKLVDLLPSLAVAGQKKTLAVLIQDQDELRSLGGVIKYLVLFEFNNSKISNIKVYDQNDINKLNDGSVKAPDSVSIITGSDSWRFRDMTYYGDFSQTSQYLSWYLSKILTVTPDSIVAINKSLFESYLTEIGGLTISDQKITAQNLKTKIGEADNGTLRSVIDYLIGEYRKKQLPLSVVGRVITNQLELGNLLIWSSDKELETSISSIPFSGVVTPYHCHSSLANYKNCISQTTYLTESNFMVAPVNNLLKRDSIHKITLLPDRIDHEYQLSYHFTQDVSVLNRDYRVIYQLYIPQSSQLTSINVDGQDLILNNLQKQTYGQFEFYQIPLAMSLSQDHNVSIKFVSPITLSSDISQTAYSLTEIRQPGLLDPGMGLVINLPENTHATIISAAADTKPQQILYRFPPKTATFGLGLGLTRQ